MDLFLIVIILAVLVLGGGWMLHAWDNRSRRRWF
jgi:high-affinity Fe2+/Pb2+ permease